jgi:hypothetical protein
MRGRMVAFKEGCALSRDVKMGKRDWGGRLAARRKQCGHSDLKKGQRLELTK